jgi:uncharacterized membrane protein HdeD (DUF308 family)
MTDPASAAGVSDVVMLRGSRAVAIGAGVVSVVAGIAMLVWPDHVLRAVAIIAGICFVISGVARVFDALVTHRAGSYWGLMLAHGIFDAVIGIIVIAYPDETVKVVAFLIGLNLVIGGIFHLVLSRQVPKGVEEHSRYLWRGIFWIVAGVVIMLLPGESANALAIIVGIFFLISGAVLLGVGVQLGKAERELA